MDWDEYLVNPTLVSFFSSGWGSILGPPPFFFSKSYRTVKVVGNKNNTSFAVYICGCKLWMVYGVFFPLFSKNRILPSKRLLFFNKEVF